jgi:hypothetical protein
MSLDDHAPPSHGRLPGLWPWSMLMAWVLWCGLLPVVAQGPATLESLLAEGQPQAPPPLPEAGTDRLPVPPDDGVTAATDLIRQAYEEDYSDAAQGSSRLLVSKLTEAVKEVDDACRKYALLVEAQRLAIQSGDLGTAIEAASKRSRLFEIDPAECRLDVLTAAAKSDQRDDGSLCHMFLGLVDQVLERDRIDIAGRAVGEAIAAARRVDKREKQAAADERRRTGRKPTEKGAAAALLESALAQQREVKNREKALAEYKEAIETLRDHPDDAAANTRVGRHRCFVVGDWQEGLPALKIGDTERLRTVANQEIALHAEENPAVDRILALASSWWKVAEAGGLSAIEVQAIKRHAADLYKKALPAIEDPIDSTLANKRIASAYPGGEARQQAAEPTTVKKSPVVGRRGSALKIPCSVILPAPVDLSRELVERLPTEAEVATLLNHVNVADADVYTARQAGFERIYKDFPIDRWTTTDALYVIELNDKINQLLGKNSVRLPRGGSMSGGSRADCKAYLAAAWLLESKNEQDFAARASRLPEDAKGKNLDWPINERRAKEWLVGLGPEYASTRRKLQAIDFLVKQGVATEGLRRYGEALAKAPGTDGP